MNENHHKAKKARDISSPSDTCCKHCGHKESACSSDETYRRAKELIGFKKHASAALLQRDLKISYAKASETLDQLEEDGLVGPAVGATPRTVNLEALSD